ncbi:MULTISPECIES: ATP-binding protein [Paenibacillus]|uniref:histidine kinase n=2 Tax=Paenibacillus TaxID=44249 RepID=A0A0U2KXE8_9BACL|nr:MULTISPECIES: ATP-binding protein [Paenibacillus]ALS21474.1 signal transduction histidine kinase [Paenibacillus naphthalenovorans]GCL71202.1 histidine kinase [Paenibacillus naphthalenovorans]SDI77361.1 diguanylate cyclase (GGDEF) domain-containing protein [Paenibacillus naphthalenovorans]
MNGSTVFVIYAGFICASSLYFQQTESPLLLIGITFIYMLSHAARKIIPVPHAVQLVLLIVLHIFSATHWILPLYLLHMGIIFYKTPSLTLALSYNLGMMTAYSLAVLTYSTVTIYTVTDIVFTAASCILMAYLFRKYMYAIEQQKQLLTNEKKHLSTHDLLTGLYNFQEFHRQMGIFVEQKESSILVLIDCKNLKSLNTTNGFQGVNKILKQAAELLRIMFPDASLIARYGGDEFAIVVTASDPKKTIHTITQLLASEFPKLTGIEINFGIASYPEDGLNKDDLILVAEHNLYMMKRESWLKREEHMLRSEKLRVVGELASGMAHEIRNPLTTVKGFLQLSRAGNYNIEPWYDLIMDEINRMSMLTAEFLQFSKPHVTHYKIQTIESCISRVISLLDSEITRLGHQIGFKDEGHGVCMFMDQDKMLQLLLNLVKNALEAMPEQGTVYIHLYLQNNNAVIEVTDTGKGIPESELDQIFIPFYTTKESGTGLGLSICHKIVQDHEGTIEVESVPNMGTKFTITLPTATAAEAAERQIQPNRTKIFV